MAGDKTEKTAAQRKRRIGQDLAVGAHWKHWVAPSRKRAREAGYRALEAVVAMTAVMGICRLLSPADPFLIKTGFGWLWLVPLILSLRYGTVVGLGSGLMMAAGWYVFYGLTVPQPPFPRAYFLGGFAIILLGGQFGDIWNGRLRQARTTNNYLSERLAVLTKAQFLLRLSHERLEQDLLAKPATLRDALSRLRVLALRDAAPATQRGEISLDGAQRFLETAAQTCQLEAARVYACRNGVLMPEPAAAIGAEFEFDVNDPLVRHALAEGRLAHLRDMEVNAQVRSRYIACAPLQDASGCLIGMLVVANLPFLALTRDNLQFLLVLCGYYADGVRHAALTREMLTAFRKCPYEFALDYARLVHLYREHKLASSLVVLVLDHSDASQTIYEHVRRSRRALDVQWAVSGAGQHAVMTLMPLAGDSGVDGYLLRIEENIRAQFGLDFETARVAVYSMSLPGADPVGEFQRFLERCHVVT